MKVSSPRRFCCGALVALALVTSLLTSAPTVFASAPGPSTPVPTNPNARSVTGGYVPYSAKWLAAKNAYLLRTGFTPYTRKGDLSRVPFVLCCPTCGNCNPPPPAAYELSTANVQGVWEPSNGENPNFGPGTANYDDSYTHYKDGNFFFLCGPGAANNALFYWPDPMNFMTSTKIKDPSVGSITTWTSERMRGYITNVAWHIQWPGWSHPGMMDDHYQSYGATLYGLQDGMNWEASGENPSDWSNYFYTIVWWNQSNENTFHQDVVNDISVNFVPVVAEVEALDLPNWKWTSNNIKPQQEKHFITIIGYDDTVGIYYYTDTCAASTTCNFSGSGKDGTILQASQSQMWQAITDVPVNQSTDPSAGDGGWVW